MKIWKPAKSVNKRKTTAGTPRYGVAYAWKKLGSKTRQWKWFDTQEEAEKYRIAHNAKLEARTHSACSAFDEATSHEIALWKHRWPLLGYSRFINPGGWIIGGSLRRQNWS